jgi:HAD superfamily hydrolase (TIGR01509 family)
MSLTSADRSNSRSAVSRWFLINGFVTASWVAHVPRQTVALEASPGSLGLALLCMALGSVLGMVAAPWVIGRCGAARGAWLAGAAFALLVPFPLLAGSVPALALALLVFGVAHGLMDVTMNVAAAACERSLGRPAMSSFHGWFSVGMVAGVAGGVGALAVGFRPAGHAATVIGLAAAFLLASRPQQGWAFRPADATPAPLSSLGLRAVVLAGLAFVCLFLEGAMADWAGLLAAAFGASPVAAPLAYVAFTAAWAGGRFVGDRLTAAVGDAAVVLAGGLFAAIGVGLGLWVARPTAVAAGCAIVGLGLANAVPILFRAAAGADPSGRGAGLVLVTGVGYAGFLIGPPLVGFTAEAIGLPRAMLLVVAGGLLLASGAVALRRRGLKSPTGSVACRAVLLDMDGTLVDSADVSEEVWREWAAGAGVDPAPILAVHHGRRPEETLRLTYPEHATAEAASWVQAAGESRTGGLRPVTGAAALLDALDGRPWAVVTSASRRLAEARLRAVGLWRGALLVAAEDVAEGKPSPEGFLAAAGRLGVRPAECVVMEDAPAGVEAARRAGMAVVAVTTTHAPEDLATPHRIRDFTALTVEPGEGGRFRVLLPAAG